MSRPRVLYLANARFPSSAAHTVQMMGMCAAFARIADTTLVSFFDGQPTPILEEYAVSEPVEVVALPARSGYYLRDLVLSWTVLRRGMQNAADVVVTRSLITAAMMCVAGVRTVYEVHDDASPKRSREIIKWPILKYVLLKASVVVFTNEHLFARFSHSRFGREPLVLENGVDVERFSHSPMALIARRELGLDATGPLIVYVGGPQPWKGAHYIYSLARSRPDWRFFIAGAPKPATSNVSVVPRLAARDVPMALAAADLLVIPNSSLHEASRELTSPLKAYEYMAAKRPIVASDVPALRRVLRDAAFFFIPDDVEDLERAVELALTDEAQSANAVQKAYKLVQDHTTTARAQIILDHATASK